MNEYTIQKHVRNIKLLRNIYSEIADAREEEKIFELVDLLADFVQQNQLHYSMQPFLELADRVVDVIEFCNSDDYSEAMLISQIEEVSSKIIILVEKIISSYEVNLFFAGRDKYGFIKNIVNQNIKLINSIKNIRHSNNVFNILVISEETCNEYADTNLFCRIIHYDKLMNDIFDLATNIYHNRYDYNYLRFSLEKAKEVTTEGIIVGSSYALHGVDESMLKGEVIKLTLASQDIYYSYKIAKNIIEENRNIKKCFIGTAFWSFHMDMSKSLEDGVQRIRDVYYPVFLDSHNYEYTGNVKSVELSSFLDEEINYLFNIDKLSEILFRIIFKSCKTYFNELRTRQNCSMVGSRRLESISLDEKMELGSRRAESHNKSVRHDETKQENKLIFEEFLQYLCNKNVQPVIINFTTSRYYSEFLSNDYRTDYNDIICELGKKYKFKYIDLNEYDVFEDEDFVDMDHMGDSGARKATDIINSIIKP